jgi:hypothetical protein
VTTVGKNAVLVVWIEVAPEDADELNRWYEEEHGPERLAMPGFVTLRRFRAHDDLNKFLAIYELEYPEAATSPEYMNQTQTEWAREMIAKWKQWDRNVWVELVSDDR